MKDKEKLDHIYHFALPSIWNKFESKDHYFPDDYEEEGFIHCSFLHQLEKVRARYYQDKEVKILKLDASKMGKHLIIEASTKGALYPHIYSPINKDWILSID